VVKTNKRRQTQVWLPIGLNKGAEDPNSVGKKQKVTSVFHKTFRRSGESCEDFRPELPGIGVGLGSWGASRPSSVSQPSGGVFV
jgi:hypothetical protein